MAPRDPWVWKRLRVVLKSLSHLIGDLHPFSALASSLLKVRSEDAAPTSWQLNTSPLSLEEKGMADLPATPTTVYYSLQL